MSNTNGYLTFNNRLRLASQIFDFLVRSNASKDDMKSALRELISTARRAEEKATKFAIAAILLDVVLIFRIYGLKDTAIKSYNVFDYVPDVGELVVFIAAFAGYLFLYGRTVWAAASATVDASIQYLLRSEKMPTAELEFTHASLFRHLIFSSALVPKRQKIFGAMARYSLFWEQTSPLFILMLHIFIQFKAIYFYFENPTVPSLLSAFLLITSGLVNVAMIVLLLHVQAIRYRFIAPKEFSSAPQRGADGHST